MAVKASAGLPVASGWRGQPTASESGKDPLDTSSALPNEEDNGRAEGAAATESRRRQ